MIPSLSGPARLPADLAGMAHWSQHAGRREDRQSPGRHEFCQVADSCLTGPAGRATLAGGLNGWEGTVDDDRARPASGAGRRGVLRNLLVLSAAAPLAGVLSRTRAQAAQDQVPAGLSSPQLAGQRVIYSYPGLTVPTALLQAITAGQAAGVIFFGPNISSEAQIASVIQQLVQAQQQSPVSAPLLLMTDQEGGKVRRLPGAPVMSEKQIGQTSDPAAAASTAGTGAGQNLAGVGMNVNLAPVLDIYYKSGNFIDEFQRSYSNKVPVVTACGQAFITAQQQTGVAATAKHFPGLGSATTSQDTDTGPVTLPVSLSELRSKDEAQDR